MIHLKIFETFNEKEPEIGQFILARDDIEQGYYDIAQIVGIQENSINYDHVRYTIKYDTPPNINFSCRLTDIMFFGTKEEMETIVAAKKYNL
jgi:hypothetical protein